jgi:hypothetical protein
VRTQSLVAVAAAAALGILVLANRNSVIGQSAGPARAGNNRADQAAAEQESRKAAAAAPADKEKKPALPNLIPALKATPGCLGVETARTSSGKQVIFAWFENRRAVLKWYYSDAHQDAMKSFFPGFESRKPLKEVPEDSGPIMVIASITMAKQAQFKETPAPISQIAIELYQPLAGGAALGGRFAPATVKVPNLRDYTPKAKSPADK